MTHPVLDAPGVSVDVDALLALRHLVRSETDANASTTAMHGGFVRRRRGRGLEVADVRVFQDGDDVRHIDRNATARTGTPHVRTFQDERERTTLLIADFRSPMLWGTRRAFRSVAAAEHLSLIGWRAITEGGRVGLMAIGGAAPLFVPARGRKRAMISVIGGLAQAHRAALENQATNLSNKPEPLEEFLRMAKQVAPRGASVVLASSLDAPGTSCETAMSELAHHTSFSILHLRDAVEQNLEDSAYPFETETGRRGLGLVTRGAHHAEDELVARLRARRIPVREIDTATAPSDARKV